MPLERALHFSAPDMTHKTLHHICSVRVEWRTKQCWTKWWVQISKEGHLIYQTLAHVCHLWVKLTGFVTITSFTVLSDLIYSTRDRYLYPLCKRKRGKNHTKVQQGNRGSVTQFGWCWIGGAQFLVFGRHFQANSPKNFFVNVEPN